jgi:membrane protein YqaA with SNARE-associated domain
MAGSSRDGLVTLPELYRLVEESLSKRLEHFHLARAAFWILLAPVLLLSALKDQVWVVILLSLYANLAGDVSSWQAGRAERRSLEHP